MVSLFTCKHFLASLTIQCHVLTEISGFKEVQTGMKVEWNSATITHGAQCVMTPGAHRMQELPADSLDSQQLVHIYANWLKYYCEYYYWPSLNI